MISFVQNGQDIKFIIKSVWVDWMKMKNGEEIKKKFCVVCVKNSSGLEVIHPLSDFILSNWSGRNYNTQRKHAVNIVAFLNYLLEYRRNLNIKSLTELEFKQGNYYLNELTKKCLDRGTVVSYERTLTHFYLYLSRKECTKHISEKNFVKKTNHRGGFYYESPFNVEYPSRRISDIEHYFPPQYLPLLFEIAISVAQPIVLGLYLQIFGGLRVGEVVNIKRSEIKRKVANGDILIKVRTNNLRTDLNDTAGTNEVKTQRSQKAFQIYDWFDTLYKDHIAIYKDSDGSGALFVNRDGKAMTDRSYRQYFDKLKREFIHSLREDFGVEGKILANHLSAMKWSTHIGRGTFTNLVAEHADNPFEIAESRGDKDLAIALTYLSRTGRYRKKLETQLQSMHENYIPRLVENQKDQ
ncbi:hypothetical protein BK127_17515 [Paenibacillus sp. FSL H7-0331]|nr:hypothetical protein BK127_17515 [Paenibacillus sp. FSL H7-0331]